MKKVIMIDEDVVNDIQAKDVEAQVSAEVILQVIDMHKLDEDTAFMESPVFKTYEKEATKKRIAFDKAKDKMFTDAVPENEREGIKEWSLNYYTRELTLVM